MRSVYRWIWRFVLGCAIVGVIALIIWLCIHPSNDRDWSPDQAVLPTATVEGDRLTVHNVRFNRYRSNTDYDVHHEDRTYDLSALDSVWYMVVPFPDDPGAAHVFLSFGFGPENFLAVSVEIRKEKGETFSAWRGLLKRYEIMYVAADERDVVLLRTRHRGDEIFAYPVKITPDKARELLLSMTDRMNTLAQTPEFYNTVTNSCATTILDHVNQIAPGKIPWGKAVLFPGYSDVFAYEQGVLDTSIAPDRLRDCFRVTDTANDAGVSEDFSRRIREAVGCREAD
jgi:hypothetical protein